MLSMMNKKSKLELIADILAVVGAIGGSTIIAMNIGYMTLAFSMFITSSITTLYLLYLARANKSLFLVNAYFLVINVVGLVRYM